MIRRLFTVASALSLLLCAAALALWVRSYWRYSGGYFATGHALLFAEHERGDLRVARIETDDGHIYKSTLDSPYKRSLYYNRPDRPWYCNPVDGTPRWDAAFVGAKPFLWRHFGVVLARGDWLAPSDIWTPLPMTAAQVPDWLVAAVLAVLPVCWFRGRLRARRRIEVGHCFACGYDLRASKERCPECGTPIPAAS